MDDVALSRCRELFNTGGELLTEATTGPDGMQREANLRKAIAKFEAAVEARGYLIPGHSNVKALRASMNRLEKAYIYLGDTELAVIWLRRRFVIQEGTLMQMVWYNLERATGVWANDRQQALELLEPEDDVAYLFNGTHITKPRAATLPHSPPEYYAAWRAKDLSKYNKRVFEVLANGPPPVSTAEEWRKTLRPCDRVHKRDLTLEKFFEYERESKPVIITGAVEEMVTEPWTIEHIVDVCGSRNVTLRQTSASSSKWGGVESSTTVTLAEAVAGQQNGTFNSSVVFDWGLPRGCPLLMDEFVVPKYFANDYLQRGFRHAGFERIQYQDTWPSLFIAKGGNTTTYLHVDSFASHFYMALLSGRKRWTFFDKEDTGLLYPESMIKYNARPGDWDAKMYPAFGYARGTECELVAGELLYVPYLSPHMVENLEDSHAISVNYLDGFNWDESKDWIKAKCVNSPDFCLAYHALRHMNDTGELVMDPTMPDKPWNEFKAGPNKTWKMAERHAQAYYELAKERAEKLGLEWDEDAAQAELAKAGPNSGDVFVKNFD